MRQNAGSKLTSRLIVKALAHLALVLEVNCPRSQLAVFLECDAKGGSRLLNKVVALAGIGLEKVVDSVKCLRGRENG